MSHADISDQTVKVKMKMELIDLNN